jgi:hypothetical protein
LSTGAGDSGGSNWRQNAGNGRRPSRKQMRSGWLAQTALFLRSRTYLGRYCHGNCNFFAVGTAPVDSILKTQEILFKVSAGQVGNCYSTTARNEKLEYHQSEVTIGWNQSRPATANDAVVQTKGKKMIEVQSVADVSEKLKHGIFDELFITTASDQER